MTLCISHIGRRADPNLHDVASHIKHYTELGGGEGVCFGADLDGTTPPSEIKSIADMPKMFQALADVGISQPIIERIFFDNAFNFFKSNI